MSQDGVVQTLEPWLREILRCPACRGPLRDVAVTRSPTQPPAEPSLELHCGVCRLAYRVDAGIPVLLVDQARALGEQE